MRLRDNGALERETAENLLQRLRAYRRPLLEPAPRKAESPILAEVVAEPTPGAVVPPIPIAPAPVMPPSPAVPSAETSPAAGLARSTQQEQPAAAPQRPWTEILAGFMEERNIRWGELIGGLLLVCSSVALVVSLWNQLQQIPYFQSFIFVAVSAAVFGVGLYAHHRWKLEATSRGLLLIGTLLVPLNFVAMAILSRGVEATAAGALSGMVEKPAMLLIAAASLAVFAWLLGLAARILIPKGWPLAVAAVVGNSAAIVGIAMWIRVGSPVVVVLARGPCRWRCFGSRWAADCSPWRARTPRPADIGWNSRKSPGSASCWA